MKSVFDAKIFQEEIQLYVFEVFAFFTVSGFFKILFQSIYPIKLHRFNTYVWSL